MKELASQNTEDLKKELTEKRKALHNVRFAFAGSTGKNVKEARELRKTIARILTELTARTKTQ